jgi:antitoxin component of MazEF toxin-antitoxin module
MGDSTGIVIDRPILDMLGLDKGDEVSLRIEKDKLIIERADESVTRGKRRGKLEKARTRMHSDIGSTLRKLAAAAYATRRLDKAGLAQLVGELSAAEE